MSDRALLTRYFRAQAAKMSTDGLDVPFSYILRQIALAWHVPPPFMRDWFSYEDVHRELMYLQCEAEAHRR